MAFNHYIVCIVDDPIHDCFCYRVSFYGLRIDAGIPFLIRILSAEDLGSFGTVEPCFYYFQEIMGFLRYQIADQLSIQNQEICCLISLHSLTESTCCLRDTEFIQKF